MNTLTVDFETFYDGEYSLTKLTIEEYIRGAQFEVIGVSVKVDDQTTHWFSGDHASTAQWLAQFPWHTHRAIAHNGLFDFAILGWLFNIHPKEMFCTQAAARWLFGVNQRLSLGYLAEKMSLGIKGTERESAIGMRRADFSPQRLSEYGAYCRNDSELTYRLYLRLLPHLPEQERHLLHWTMKAYTRPMLEVDGPIVRNELYAFYEKRSGLLDRLGVTLEQLRSDGQMADLLRQLGVEPPVKPSPTRKNPDGTPVQAYAFSKQDLEFSDLLEHENDDVAMLVEARLGMKTSLVESRLKRFSGIAERGLLPVPLDFAGATNTRRWSGRDSINLQNLPRNPKGGKSPLRQAIRAPADHWLMSSDLSQIELRINAWQSGATGILDLLRTGGDVYSVMASRIFGFAVDKHMHPSERFVGKTAVLGCGYQCGAAKFHHMLQVDSRRYNIPLADDSLDFAQRVVDTYRAANPEIVALWRAAQQAIPLIAAKVDTQIGPYPVRNGRVLLPDGVYLYYPNLRQRVNPETDKLEWVYDRIKDYRKTTSTLYGGKLVENITQAVAALPMKRALLRIDEHFPVVGTVHDELLVLVPRNYDVDAVSQWVSTQMRVAPEWAPDIPLDCETHYGGTYADLK
jgi:DNA polymerase I-like protein with 3'-5' exonuclease and polymerase domains